MNLCTVILAGGLGTRMKSSLPKLLHDLLGKTVIERTLEVALKVDCKKTVVVLNRDSEAINKALPSDERISIAIQSEPLGTADALKSALVQIPEITEVVMVLNGDTPLIRLDTLKDLLQHFYKNSLNIGFLSFLASNPSEYGRVVRDSRGMVLSIVENRDATELQKSINEVNGGVYLIDKRALGLLQEIKADNSKGEYYLTDLIGLAVKAGMRVDALCISDETELIGINTRQDLIRALEALRARTNNVLLQKGVTLIDPTRTIIEPEVKIGIDTIIYPNVIIQGTTIIGSNCVIYPNSRISNSYIEEGVTIKDCSVIEGSYLKRRAMVGPFAHIRPGSVIGEEAKIGNFVEVKKSKISKGVKASHLSYIGDAEVGEYTNIGAGTITCNYDGVNKHKTIIGSGVFIGSDTQLIAPVVVGEGAYIGAGSTITKDVPPNSLGISRSPQRNLKGWAERRKKKPQT